MIIISKNKDIKNEINEIKDSYTIQKEGEI